MKRHMKVYDYLLQILSHPPSSHTLWDFTGRTSIPSRHSGGHLKGGHLKMGFSHWNSHWTGAFRTRVRIRHVNSHRYL